MLALRRVAELESAGYKGVPSARTRTPYLPPARPEDRSVLQPAHWMQDACASHLELCSNVAELQRPSPSG